MGQSLREHVVHPVSDAALTRGVLARRLCALVVDLVVIGIISWALAIFILIFGVLTLGVGWLLFHIIPVLPLAYYTLLVGRGTPGQRLFGISVRQDANLLPPSLAQALAWSVLMWVSFLLACVPFALALLEPRHRAAHDLLSGLVVVRNSY